jgi:hypothetical protein
MDIRKINRGLSVSPQIAPADMAELKMAGFRSIICNRPDGEGADQPTFRKSRRPPAPPVSRLAICPSPRPRSRRGCRQVRTRRCPICPGRCSPIAAPGRARPRSGPWPRARGHATADILAATKAAGYDMSGVVRRIANGGKTPTDVGDFSHDIVIIGGGRRHFGGLEPARPGVRPRHRHHRPAGRALLPARMDHGRRRHFRARSHRPHHGVADPARCILDQGRRGGLRAQTTP